MCVCVCVCVCVYTYTFAVLSMPLSSCLHSAQSRRTQYTRDTRLPTKSSRLNLALLILQHEVISP